MVAVISNLLRRFLGAGWRPEMVCFSHSRTAGFVRCQRIFGQMPLFDHERTMPVVRAEDLAAEIPGADPIAAGFRAGAVAGAPFADQWQALGCRRRRRRARHMGARRYYHMAAR
jgi:hypothetical protein